MVTVTAAGIYDLRRLRHGSCGGLGVMALLAPAVAYDYAIGYPQSTWAAAFPVGASPLPSVLRLSLTA